MVKKENKQNKKGVAAFILGICSVVLSSFFIISVPAGIVGLILSIQQKKIFQNDLNKIGYVLSIIGIILGILAIIWFVFISASIVEFLSTPMNLGFQ